MSGVWAGVLAAGEGRRLGGRPKALLSFGEATFLEAIVETARRGGVDKVAVVLGHHADEVRPLAQRCCDVVAINPTPERGMGSSARALARALPPGAAMLLWPVDHPAVRPESIRALLEASEAAGGDRWVVPVNSGAERGGHPPLLTPALVEALRRLPRDQRLDRFLEAHGGPPLRVEVEDEGVDRDVDQPEDLARLSRALE